MVKAIFPGTFDPIHYGHIDIARRASRLFDEVVMAVYDKPLKNLLFSPEERIALVEQACADNPKISVTGYSGLTVDFCRKIGAQVVVRGLRVFSDFEFEFRMALANQRLAPDIETIALITAEHLPVLQHSQGDRHAGWRRVEHGPALRARGDETQDQQQRPSAAAECAEGLAGQIGNLSHKRAAQLLC
jgi:pantetheine-phosphate adenylyltransferase